MREVATDEVEHLLVVTLQPGREASHTGRASREIARQPAEQLRKHNRVSLKISLILRRASTHGKIRCPDAAASATGCECGLSELVAQVGKERVVEERIGKATSKRAIVEALAQQ